MPKLATRKPDTVFRNAKPRKKQYLIADGGGLSLRVHSNGPKLWVFRYLRPTTKRENMMSLGPYRDLTPAQARELAAAARAAVREGIDPVEQKRGTREAVLRDEGAAFPLIAARWLKFKDPGWAVNTRIGATNIVNNHLIPALKNQSIATLSTAGAAKALEAIAAKGGPAVAIKASQRLNEIAAFAIRHGLRGEGMLLQLKGAVPKYEKGHVAAVTKQSGVGPMVRAIDKYKSPIMRAGLQITMLTALRPDVVAAAPWSEIDLDAAEWHIPAARMKTDHDHIVPLSVQAVAILKALEPLTRNKGFVFASPHHGGKSHIKRDSLGNALRKMGLKGEQSPHGFRAMLRTLGRERLKIDKDVLDAQLAHAKKGEVEKSYDRTALLDERREAMQKWADYIDGMRADNVIELRSA